jgi:hypothetical protein
MEGTCIIFEYEVVDGVTVSVAGVMSAESGTSLRDTDDTY